MWLRSVVRRSHLNLDVAYYLHCDCLSLISGNFALFMIMYIDLILLRINGYADSEN